MHTHDAVVRSMTGLQGDLTSNNQLALSVNVVLCVVPRIHFHFSSDRGLCFLRILDWTGISSFAPQNSVRIKRFCCHFSLSVFFFCCCCFHKSASIGKHCLRYSKGRIGISDPTSFRDTGPGKQETQTQSAYLCGLALKHLSLCTLSYCVGKVGIVMVRQLVTSLKQNPWKYLPCGDCFMLLIA